MFDEFCLIRVLKLFLCKLASLVTQVSSLIKIRTKQGTYATRTGLAVVDLFALKWQTREREGQPPLVSLKVVHCCGLLEPDQYRSAK